MSECFTGCAPPKPGPAFKVVQVRAGGVFLGVICSPTIWGVMTHWNDLGGPRGRSERCCAPKATCYGCDKQLPSRWKGWLHCFDLRTRNEIFLEITPAGGEQIEIERPKDGTLRGLKIEARRSQGGDRGRFTVTLGLFSGDLEKLPAAKDPEPVLEVLWNWRR